LKAGIFKRAGWLALMLSTAVLADQPLPVVPQVDLQKYAGRWYEIARLPNRFERECAKDITATYKVLPDNRLDVLNQCIKADGAGISARGVARSSDGSTSRLEVRFAPSWLGFLPLVWGDYWIIALDPEYQWSLVGSPDRDYLWILARTPTLDSRQVEHLLEKAKALGFPTETIIFVKTSSTKTDTQR
jgi:apolipoprotein D and lipocalin family protein